MTIAAFKGLTGIAMLAAFAAGAEAQSPANLGADYSFEFLTLPFQGASNDWYALGVNEAGSVVGYYWTVKPCFPGEGCTIGYLMDSSGYDKFYVGRYTMINGINDAGLFVGRLGGPTPEPGFQYDPNTDTFTLIAFPGAQLTIANGISNAGAVCGLAEFGGNISNGFILQDGVYTQVAYPNTTDNELYGINSSGQAVGCSRPTLDQIQGYVYQNGTFQTLNYPGATATCAYGINDNGVIVGSYATAGLQMTRSFVYRDGVFYPFDQPNCDITLVYGINNHEVVVGASCGGNFIATPVE
ncbi:MAG TPA: hypothetical protein VMI94_01280 [Bryobacteraceae bacterium]|nr:hypothetical protein [Bryobacteraceae bacterium]